MNYLEEDIVAFNVTVSDAKAAIREAGELLVKGGVVEKTYVDAMVKSYEDNGPYFVIAPGVAIPHARPEDGALESAVSLVKLKEPINFGNAANDPVTLVFGLSASNGEEHLATIQRIAKFLKNKETIAKLQDIDTYESLERLKEEMS